MSYQMEKIRRMAAEMAMEMMKDVQPELLEETEIDNEKMSDFDFKAPVDNEKIAAPRVIEDEITEANSQVKLSV